MQWRIRHRGDHYEVYVNGEFYCSADTFNEAVKELEQLEEQKRKEREGNLFYVED